MKMMQVSRGNQEEAWQTDCSETEIDSRWITTTMTTTEVLSMLDKGTRMI